MESVLGRYKNLIWLVAILFLQVLGLAVQVKRGGNGNDAENTRLIRIWVVGAITPFERGLVWVESSSSNLWHNYFYLRGVRAENRELKQQIEQMRLEQVRLSEDAAQAHRLQALLAFKEQYIAKTVAAQVIGSSGSDLSRTVYIDKGEDAGLKRDMAVITADGIVGKLMVVYPSTAQVLLINDQTSGVGVILEKSRLQGVLRGSANGEVVLERIMSDEQVSTGETVLTSGGDQIFPKGLPVGTITKVANGKDLFLNIKVEPAADLSKLEEVLVLVEKQDREPMAEDSTHRRAADILAERLPSVPDKPAANANASASSAAGSTRPSSAIPGSAAAGSSKPGSPTSGSATSGSATSGSATSGSAKQGSALKPSATTASAKPATTTSVPQVGNRSSTTASDHTASATSGTVPAVPKLSLTPKTTVSTRTANRTSTESKPAATGTTQPSDLTPPKPAPAAQTNPPTPPQTGDNPQ